MPAAPAPLTPVLVAPAAPACALLVVLRVDGVEGADATDVGKKLTPVVELDFSAPASPVEEDERLVASCLQELVRVFTADETCGVRTVATPVFDELPEAEESVMVEVEGEPETVTWLVTMDVIVDRLVVVAGPSPEY